MTLQLKCVLVSVVMQQQQQQQQHRLLQHPQQMQSQQVAVSTLSPAGGLGAQQQHSSGGLMNLQGSLGNGLGGIKGNAHFSLSGLSLTPEQFIKRP